MSENMLSIRDLKLISADAYARGTLGVTAETAMDVAADVVDMLIMREHYKISSALHIVGMSAEQYVAVRARAADCWWDRDEDEEKSEEAEAADKKYEMWKEVLNPLWKLIENGKINWEDALEFIENDEMKKAILQYREECEADYEQYSDRLKKTLAFCKSRGMSLKEVLEHFRENTHWIIRRCAKEIGYEVSTPEKDDEV